MKKHCLLPLLMAAAVLASGCQAAEAADTTGQTALVTPSDMFTDRDLEVGYDETTAAAITLSGSAASCDSDAVTIDGSTITITDEGTYLLSGTLDDGMVIVDAEDTDKIQLVLNGTSIHCADCAALYVRQADKVFVTTAADTQNMLSGGDTFTPLDENNIDGVIFSKSDLTLNGLGTLTIDSPAGHGVVTKDDLAVTSGTYAITAAEQGLSGKDSVRIADGTFTLTTGKDAIQSDNTEDTDKGFVYLAGGTFTITAEGDGLSASSWMQVDDATCTITTGGGSANGETHVSDTVPGGMGGGKGERMPQMDGSTAPDGSTQPPEPPTGETPPDDMQPPADMPQNAAPSDSAAASDTAAATTTDTADSTDASTTDTVSTKGLKAGTALTILGGDFTLDCADDAFHSNGDLTVSGGTVYVSTKDGSADSALDYNGNASITGGTLIGAGSSGMAQNFGENSTQGAILLTVDAQAAGSTVSISDSAGNVLASWDAPQAFSSVVISCPGLEADGTYTVTTGTSSTEVTLDGLLYGSGGMGHGGMGGGNRANRGETVQNAAASA